MKKQHKYKSKLEERVAEELQRLGVVVDYEPMRLGYLVPTSKHHYTPDFVPRKNKKIIFEAKGRLTIADKKKMLLLKEQYPDHKFYLLFERANKPLYKGSKTTYGEWATAHGFEWADFTKNGIPKGWLNDLIQRKKR